MTENKVGASINIITLGCSKNSVDSEVLAAKFVKEGYKVFHEITENTDIVIINTCAFIHDAKEESIEEILLQIQRKLSGEIAKIYVIGCLSQRYKKDLIEMLPEVDGFFSFSELNQLLNVPHFDLLESYERILSTPSHYAYLKISEGCNRECAFCAIPSIRGKYISKPVDLLIKEAEMLAEKGVKELMLIAQDLTYYGVDIYKRKELAKLLKQLTHISGIEWLRLHYAYPSGFPYEILDVMNEYSQFCKYLDIPFQHVSDSVLRSMHRGNNSIQTYKLIEDIRTRIPGIALRTTLISGFPTETHKEHRELIKFIKDIRFERLGVFSYSPEEGTLAFGLGDPIKKAEKNRRFDEIMALQEQISLEINQSKVDTIMKVIIDTEEEEFYIGRTEFDSPGVDNEVLIGKNRMLTPGNFYSVYIEKADYFDLYGKEI